MRSTSGTFALRRVGRRERRTACHRALARHYLVAIDGGTIPRQLSDIGEASVSRNFKLSPEFVRHSP